MPPFVPATHSARLHKQYSVCVGRRGAITLPPISGSGAEVLINQPGERQIARVAPPPYLVAPVSAETEGRAEHDDLVPEEFI